VACDVRTRFVDAAAVFAPQKGATPPQVRLLGARLEQLAERYLAEYGVDVRDVDGTGAAGGLAGGLLAVGARLLPGFELVADHVGLDERLASADVVVTGEGNLDAQSLDGKVVGGICDLATKAGKPVVVIVGDADPDAKRTLLERSGRPAHRNPGVSPPRSPNEAQAAQIVEVVSLVERFGEQRAFAEPRWCIERATRQTLEAMG
jgi:glycerate kinase